VARLRHVTSGAVVSVADEKVERLGSEWEPLDEKPKTAKKPAAKPASK